MQKRGSAADFVLTEEQFEALLETAAAVKDTEKSIECFAFLLLMGRYSLRAGELMHMCPGWQSPDLPGIRLPTFHDCNCNYCQNRAKDRVGDDVEDTEAAAEEFLEEYWSPKSVNGARPIPFDTERIIDATNRYMALYGTVGVSYSTVYRRVVKMAEYTEGVDASELTPQVLRATAATWWAGRGLPPATLQKLFGWHDPSVAVHYVDVAGSQLLRRMKKVRGMEPKIDNLPAPDDPPTWEEMRPDRVADRVEIQRWDLREQDGVPDHPRQSEEEMIKETVLGDYGGEEDSERLGVFSATPTGAAFSLAAHGGGALEQRARVEECAMRNNPEMADPTLSHATGVLAMCLVPALALVAAVAVGDGSTAAAGMLLGAGYGAYDVDL